MKTPFFRTLWTTPSNISPLKILKVMALKTTGKSTSPLSYLTIPSLIFSSVVTARKYPTSSVAFFSAKSLKRRMMIAR
jgi:hypothetical protein